MRGRFIDLTGKRFNRLIVINRAANIGRQVAWNCVCDCGNNKIVRGDHLTRSKVKSCGCLNSEQARINGRKNALSKGEAAFNALILDYKEHARERGLSFELSTEEFRNLTKLDCHYCGSKPFQIKYQKGYNGSYIYNGIDRFDNSIGYNIDNCVPCCKYCNRAKGVMEFDDFFTWISRVYINLKS